MKLLISLLLIFSFSLEASPRFLLGLGVGLGAAEDSDEENSANRQRWLEQDIEADFLAELDLNIILGLYLTVGHLRSWTGGAQEYVYTNNGSTTRVTDVDADIRTDAYLLGLKYRFFSSLPFTPFIGVGAMKGDINVKISNNEFFEKHGSEPITANPEIHDFDGTYAQVGVDVFAVMLGVRFGMLFYQKKTAAFETMDNSKLTLEGKVFYGSLLLGF